MVAEVASGTGGSVWVAGPMMCRATAQPGGNSAAFCGSTGNPADIGSIDAEGYVGVFDRKKDMISHG